MICYVSRFHRKVYDWCSVLFEKLKRVLKEVVDVIATKQISIKEFDEKYAEQLIIELVESDVALPIAEEIISKLREVIMNLRIKRSVDVHSYLRQKLKEIILKFFEELPRINIEESIRKNRPLIIVFLGVNGVGKTTTIAKIAYMFKKSKYTPLMVAADTFRAGAQEQLLEHAKRIEVPVFTRPYGTDPAAVVFDAIVYAKQNNFQVVLIDTAGRMHTDIDLVEELRKIIRVSKPHYRLLVVDALTGNDAVEQARLFNEKVGVDGIIVTKVDADVKGGTMISVAYSIKKPILYIGIGQKYDDLREFNPEWLVNAILPS